jgi:hypothetical protein
VSGIARTECLSYAALIFSGPLALGHALHGYVIGVMAERLTFASHVIGVLQR